MAKLAITSAVLLPTTDLIQRCITSWEMTRTLRGDETEIKVRRNTPEDNLGVTSSLQWCYENTIAPIIACIHSDCEIFEQGWDERVLREFDDPKVGVVGFGGALQLGEDDIYRTPYRLQQLRRIGYRSNTCDAEQHGERFAGACDVATLDGFALVVRRALLDRWVSRRAERVGPSPSITRPMIVPEVRGWPVQRYPFHNYDNALCLEAHRQGWRVRLVGIDCLHHGGATATTPAYQQWSEEKLGMTDAQVHERSHLALYEDGRGILPLKVKV